jgi:hypothetical protein
MLREHTHIEPAILQKTYLPNMRAKQCTVLTRTSLRAGPGVAKLM